MNTFVRRNTIREIDIEGNKFSVDFGRDDIKDIVANLERAVKEVQEKNSNIQDTNQHEQEAVLEVKKLYRKAIDGILEVNVADKILKDTDNSILYADIYLFLIKNYTEVTAQNSPYSPQRIVNRA